MKILLVIIIAITMQAFYPNCNQAGIKNVWLYSQSSTPGILRSDENGNKINNTTFNHYLYIEVKNSNQIVWETVEYKNVKYALSTTNINEQQVNIGTVENEIAVVIKAKNNRKIIKLQMNNMNFYLNNNEGCDITLFGKNNEETVSYSCTAKNVNLLPVLYQ